MLDHHIQRAIVTKLKSSDALSFTELKGDDLDNKLFTYHLKAAMREKFVEKTEDGRYRLTSAGEKLWKRMSEDPETIALRPFSVLFLIVKSAEAGWLLYRRKTHPVKDKIAFMHAIPNNNRSIIEHASKETLERTGLVCQYSVIGSGFFRTYDGERLDSFTNFTVLASQIPSGTLVPNDEHADYFWVEHPDFSSSEMLPNMKLLSEKYLEGSFPFFIDESVQLRT